MNILPINQFFSNLITIELKDGHRFEGLLSKIDYAQKQFQLVNVEDLGNSNDKNSIPHTQKLQAKKFEAAYIKEIEIKSKLFGEPKKYNKAQFWDPISEQSSNKPRYVEKKNVKNDRNQGTNYRGDYKGGQQRRGNYKQGDKSEYQKKRPYKEYTQKKQQQPKKQAQEYDQGEFR